MFMQTSYVRLECDDVDYSYKNYLPCSWDNGDTEKMSPWDMEPIPDDGGYLLIHTDTITGVPPMKKENPVII